MCRDDKQTAKPHESAAFLALVSRQLGVFTRRQALKHGVSDQVLLRKSRAGVWVAEHRGVYRVAAAPVTRRQSLMAACLLGGSGAFASHRSAAELWSLMDGGSAAPEISTSRRITSTREVRWHRVGSVPGGDVVTLDPFHVSSPTRTLIELAGVLEGDALEEAVDAALRRRLTSAARICRRLDRMESRGTAGAGRLRGAVAPHGGRRSESVLERRFSRLVASAGLPRPAPQFTVRDAGGFVARVDFAYPSARVAIEVDGYEFHSGRERWEKDRSRRNRIEAAGWRVLNITAAQLRHRPEDVLALLRTMLGRTFGS